MDLATKEVINQKNRISASVEIFLFLPYFLSQIENNIFRRKFIYTDNQQLKKIR